MKTLKKIGFIVLVIVVLPCIAALFIPKSYTISVSETINKPKDEVYNYMRMLNNQKNYNMWIMEDPELSLQVKGTDGSVGAIQQWNSKISNVGEGEQEITMLSPEKINLALRFKRPMEGTAYVTNSFKPIARNQTQVTAEFQTSSPYPMNLLSFVFGRKMIKETQTKNLQNLKRILETKQSSQADLEN
ncbi:MAG TPA: SRPBCC family protein [Bacteroidales bacterium]|nr:SRPBCC family protein [Bacteroidales bacterium]